MNRRRLLILLILTALAASSLAGETNLVGAASIKVGRSLFLKNCAHCHGNDASGDEGPDLHGLKRSDEWIDRRIRNGVKGEMTAFGEKFSQLDVAALIAYLRSLVPADHNTNRDGVPLGIVIDGVRRANGVFEFGFTTTPGASLTAAAVTNLSPGLTNRTVLGAVTEISPAKFQFTDLDATNNPQCFYHVRSP